MGESKNEGIKQCVDKIEKSPREHYMSRKLFYFETNFYTFKVVIEKNSRKFTMFQKSFYMFKAFKKNIKTRGLFVSKVFVPYQMFTKSFQFFCELGYIP